MTVDAKVEFSYYNVPGDDGLYGRVFIAARNAYTQDLVNATGTVRYAQSLYNATRVIELAFNGQQIIQIYAGLLSGNGLVSKFLIQYDNLQQATTEPEFTPCDLSITGIQQTKPASAPGANDAQIIVNASSSYGMQYSINNGETWQTSRTFSGLTGGLLQVLVRDANPEGCTKQASITITTLRSLLADDPGVNIAGNSSRWNAAFNPIVFTYQRRDLEVTGITGMVVSDISKLKLLLNGDAGSIKADERIYVNTGTYKGVFKVISTGAGFVVVDAAYAAPPAGQQTGFINSNTLRPYYKVFTRITSTHPETNEVQTITSTNRPDGTGLVRADISSFLQSLLQVKDDSDYTQPNHRDSNLSASYQIAYAEDWDGKQTPGGTPQFIMVAQPWYVVYAAKQLGENYGGNLAAYVPFKTSSSPARWLTDFAEPAYSNGYPFDIGFLYGEDMLGLPLYCEFTPLDINRRPLNGDTATTALLNEDSSWLLNQDDSRLLISRQISGNMQVPAQLGINRLLINNTFPADAYYVAITLKYDDEDGTHPVTKTQVIRIDKAIDDNSVYLRWIGLSGSWEYYRFVYNQEISLDVQNAVIIKNYVTDWQNQQGIEEVISKTAGQKMKVMAEDLSVTDIKGLQSIKYSPKVQMLLNKNPVKWQTVVVNTATYSEYETRNGQGPFSITFSLPAINVQGQ